MTTISLQVINNLFNNNNNNNVKIIIIIVIIIIIIILIIIRTRCIVRLIPIVKIGSRRG